MLYDLEELCYLRNRVFIIQSTSAINQSGSYEPLRKSLKVVFGLKRPCTEISYRRMVGLQYQRGTSKKVFVCVGLYYSPFVLCQCYIPD